MSERKEIP